MPAFSELPGSGATTDRRLPDHARPRPGHWHQTTLICLPRFSRTPSHTRAGWSIRFVEFSKARSGNQVRPENVGVNDDGAADWLSRHACSAARNSAPVSYTHLTLPTNR